MPPLPLLDMSRLIVLARARHFELVDDTGGDIYQRLQTERARRVADEFLRPTTDDDTAVDDAGSDASAGEIRRAVVQLRRIAGVPG